MCNLTKQMISKLYHDPYQPLPPLNSMSVKLFILHFLLGIQIPLLLILANTFWNISFFSFFPMKSQYYYQIFIGPYFLACLFKDRLSPLLASAVLSDADRLPFDEHGCMNQSERKY